MERDLRLIHQKRTEKDRANGILVDPSSSKETEEQSPDAESAPVGETAPAESEIIGESMPIDEASDQAADFSLGAEPATDLVDQILKETDEKASEEATQEALSTVQGMPQDSADSVGLAITMAPEAIGETSEQPKAPEDKPTEAVASTAEVPLEMSDAAEIDFESMFNDTDLTNADDTLNFDFGLSSTDDVTMNQDILLDSSFENINMSIANNAEISNANLGTTEGIDSLLPGVENYLNADTDFSNISIPTTTALPQASQAPIVSAGEVAAATEAPTAQDPGAPAPAETSFDDNFFGDFDMGGADDLGDGTLNLDDFDWS